jgi:lysophospholipase L1-like esterase
MVHTALPETQILCISIKPSILRRRQWDKMQKANDLLSAAAEKDARIEYIDVATAMLDSEGEPLEELFAWDGLHLSAEGYALWASVIKPVLERAWVKTRPEQNKIESIRENRHNVSLVSSRSDGYELEGDKASIGY